MHDCGRWIVVLIRLATVVDFVAIDKKMNNGLAKFCYGYGYLPLAPEHFA
jgi:hypothetical protein